MKAVTMGKNSIKEYWKIYVDNCLILLKSDIQNVSFTLQVNISKAI
jgi:hypothetical protein